MVTVTGAGDGLGSGLGYILQIAITAMSRAGYSHGFGLTYIIIRTVITKYYAWSWLWSWCWLRLYCHYYGNGKSW